MSGNTINKTKNVITTSAK